MTKPFISLIYIFGFIACSYGQLNPKNVNVLFQENTVPRIDIFIDPSVLNTLLAEIDSDTEYPATFVYNNFNGVQDTIENIGFRIRGNVSRISEKKSFKVSFNTFEPGRKYYGIEKMNLKATGDDTFIRPKLAWHMCRQMGITSTWVSHVMLFINNELWGIYTNTEHVDENFLKQTFKNNNGNLYKCRYPAELTWKDSNPNSYKETGYYFENRQIRIYELKTNTDKDDYSDLMELIRIINNPNETNFNELLNNTINLNTLIRFFALEVYLGHWDSYSYPANNFYLYHNTETGKFEYITYDMDLTMGVNFSSADPTNGNMYAYFQDSASRPLRSNILSVPELRNQYTFYMKQLIKKFPPDTIRVLAKKVQDFIRPYVAQDPYISFTMEEYNNCFDQAFGMSPWGLVEFFELRYSSIIEQLEETNTSPILTEIKYSNQFYEDEINISCTLEDDDSNPDIRLYYRLNEGELQEAEMELVSNDETYGISKYQIVLDPMNTTGIIEFYIKATDAQEQSSRQPYNGNYIISLYAGKPNLKINEILTSNTICMTDEFGDNDDWIEIINADTIPVSLSNKYLSDSYENKDEWKLPDIILQPGEIAWFWADNESEQGDYHAEFKLSRNGETLYLFEDFGDTYLLLDSLNYPEQKPNISYGYNVNNYTAPLALDHITPGYSNDTRNLSYMTFDVDMNLEINRNNFNPVYGIVDVVGSFNDWSGSDSFFDADADGIYSYTINNLLLDETIYYRFRLNQDDANIEFSEITGNEGHRFYTVNEGCNYVTHTFNDEVSLIKQQGVADILVYPNPAVDYINIVATEESHLEIYNIQGRIVIQENLYKQENTIKLDKLETGSYIFKIRSNNKVSTGVLLIE
ncbi:MAG: CotH kinase family protein [Bacteroidales bacterium]|nr:CotH kinase family protein [Bacteroidales bacterium]